MLNYWKRPADALTQERLCFMDSSSIPTAPLMAGGSALLLVMLPTLFGRKGPGHSEVYESLLSRVNHLRQGQFPVRYKRLSAVEARAKLLAEAREGTRLKLLGDNQQSNALTLIEVIALIAVLVLLVGLLVPWSTN